LIASDYPALYRDADSASLRAQSNFIQAMVSSLTLLVFSAALSVINYPTAWFGAIQIVCLLSSMGLTIFLAHQRPQRVWYETRALAESIKTVTWRFVMRAEPYCLPDAEARRHLCENIRRILSDNRGSRHAVAYSDGEQITDKMNEVRALPFDGRKSIYESRRIIEQLSWYRKKAKLNDKLSRRWFTLLIGLQALAVVCAMGRIFAPKFNWWPTDVFIAAAGASFAWLQTKRFQEIAASYSLTAHEIGLLKAKLSDVSTEEELSAFVGDAENAFSREHTQWRARRDVD
jgi:hypothetical protein